MHRWIRGLGIALLGLALWAGAEGDPLNETPQSARAIPFKLGLIDAVTGGMSLRIPVGPRLPGRIPLGFTYFFDSTDSTQSQIGGSVKPIVWPGGFADPFQVTVTVDGQAWAFYAGTTQTAAPMPTLDQLHARMATFGIDDGAGTIPTTDPDGTPDAPSSRAFDGKIYASIDGTKFLLLSRWTCTYPVINKDGTTGHRTGYFGLRAVVFNGPNAIWTDFSSRALTHFVNIYGDHVTVQETGSTSGAPDTIKITNANSPTEWIQWSRAAGSPATCTVSNSPSIHLPVVTLTGDYATLERIIYQGLGVYHDPYVENVANGTWSNESQSGTNIFDAGLVLKTMVETAGSDSRTTTFQWAYQYPYQSGNPFPDYTLPNVTVPQSYVLSSITYASGYKESFDYVHTGRLSREAFSNGAFAGYFVCGLTPNPLDTSYLTNGYLQPANQGALGVSRYIGSFVDPVSKQNAGFTVVIGRTQPIAQYSGYNSSYAYGLTFKWAQANHVTTILRFGSPSANVQQDPYRGVRLTHPSGRTDSNGYILQGKADQADYLFCTSAILKEEYLHGSGGMTSNTSYNGQVNAYDWDVHGYAVDKQVFYDNWNAATWINPNANGSADTYNRVGSVMNPVATQVQSFTYANAAPGGTGASLPVSRRLLSAWDDFGPTQRDEVVNVKATVPSVTGTSTSAWSGGIAATAADSVTRTSITTRHWDAGLMQLLTDTQQNNLTSSMMPNLRPTAVSPVDFGTVSYTYDAMGRVNLVTGTRGSSVATEARTYFGSTPQLQETTKALSAGGTTFQLSGQVGKKYTYDTSAYSWLASETDKLDGRATHYNPDAHTGVMQSIIDVDGITTEFHYDAWGRIQSKTRDAVGSVGAVTTTYTYAVDGSKSTETVTAEGKTLTTTTLYDPAGRVIKVTRPDGTYQTTSYNGWGETVSQSPWLKPGQTVYGNTTWIYDGKGRRVTETDPKGRCVFYQPSDPTGNMTTGDVTTTVYTPDPNATTASAPTPPTIPPGWVSRTEVHDILGQKKSITDQIGHSVSFTYDKDGHLASTTQGAQTRSYTYDDNGWLKQRIEPEEGTTTFSNFTMLGMPLTSALQGNTGTQGILTTRIALGDWGLPIEIKTYEGSTLSTDRVLLYDSTTHRPTNLWETQPNGTLCETYLYDDLRRLKSKTVADETGQLFTVSQVLDSLGNVKSLTYPAGGGQAAKTKTVIYDDYFRTDTVNFNGTQRGSMDYDAVSGTAVTTTLTYGASTSALKTLSTVDMGELTHVTHQASGLPGGDEPNDMTWSALGLLLTRGHDAQIDTFGYDKLQRLTSATVFGNDPNLLTEKEVQTFTYDLYGNRSAMTSIYTGNGTKPAEALTWTGACSAANNQLPAAVSTSTGSQSTDATYDDFGRLTEVWTTPGQPSTQTNWDYDASGRVVSENGVLFLLDAEGLRFRSRNADGSIHYTVYGFGREPLMAFDIQAQTLKATQTLKAVSTLMVDPGDDPPDPPLHCGATIVQPSGNITVNMGSPVTFVGSSSTPGATGQWGFIDDGGACIKSFTATHTFTATGVFRAVFQASAPGFALSNVTVYITVVDVTGVTVSPSRVSLICGTSKTLSANVVGVGTILTTVTWSCTGGQITTAGVYKAPLTHGTYTVTATSVQDPTVKGTCTVTVSSQITGLSITVPKIDLQPGDQETFTTTWTGVGDYSKAVTWSCTGAGDIDPSTGAYTAPNSSETCTITATSVQDPTQSDTATVNVTFKISSFTVTPSTVTATTGHTQVFTATVAGLGTFDHGVTWSCPTGWGTFSASGVYSPPASTVHGPVTITATSKADTSQKCTATISVNPSPTGLTIIPGNQTLKPGETLGFGVYGTGTGDFTPPVTWTCTGGSMKSGDGYCTYTAPASVGTYTLTATSTQDTTKKASATITVTGLPALVWSKTMIYGFGTLLCEDQATNGTVYMMGDQVGSPNYMVNAAGAILGRTKNLPFGERFGSSGNAKSIRRYTNHEDDANTGAIYMQARTYLPAYGKFAQVDPAYSQLRDDPETWNLYNYCTNNPVTNTDPEGRVAEASGGMSFGGGDSFQGMPDDHGSMQPFGGDFSPVSAGTGKGDPHKPNDPNNPNMPSNPKPGDTTTLDGKDYQFVGGQWVPVQGAVVVVSAPSAQTNQDAFNGVGAGVFNQNRIIGTNRCTSNFNPVSHTFTFTTNPDGTLANTYSWRNVGPYNGTWFQNEPNDIAAAQVALSGQYILTQVGGPEMASCMQQAFDSMSGQSHPNLWVTANCKTEAAALTYSAYLISCGF